MSTGGKKILALDGGGMRGLFSLAVLIRLEELLGKPLYEAFDLIGGTSTGGIIALSMLLKKPLKEMVKLYHEMGQKVFVFNYGAYPRYWMRGEFYDHIVLEEILKRELGEHPMSNFTNSDPKVFIVSCNATTSQCKPYLFRTYTLPHANPQRVIDCYTYSGTKEIRLWEAARATSAGPGYFPVYRFNDMDLVDGGMVANNPVRVAIHEASELWGRDCYDVIVSVGNGQPPPTYGGKRDILTWAETSVDLLTSSDNIHIETGIELNAKDFDGVYCRLDPPNCFVELDETNQEKLALCSANVAEYLEDPNVKARLNRVVAALQ